MTRKVQGVKKAAGGIRRACQKTIATKDRISLRVIHYKSRIDDIRRKGEGYKTRVISEIRKDKMLAEGRKADLIAQANRVKSEVVGEVNVAKKEVKSSIFTEKDREIFRNIGRDIGILLPPRSRRKAPKSRRRRCASPQVKTIK